MYATDISIAFDRHVLPYGIEGLSEPSRLEDAAREGTISPQNLMRRLNSEIHTTQGQYLLQARMLRAMESPA